MRTCPVCLRPVGKRGVLVRRVEGALNPACLVCALFEGREEEELLLHAACMEAVLAANAAVVL